MISEAVQFMRKFSEKEDSGTLSLEWQIDQISQKYPNIVIINVLVEKNQLEYTGFTLLSSEAEKDQLNNMNVRDMNTWLKENQNILGKLNFMRYVSPMSEKNKRIGSTGGLATFSMFHFKINSDWFLLDDETNKLNFEKKIEKSKYKEEDMEQLKIGLTDEENIYLLNLNSEDGVRKIYNGFLTDILQKFDLTREEVKEYLRENNGLQTTGNRMDEKIEALKRYFDNVYVYLNIKEKDYLVDKLLKSFLVSRIFLTPETIRDKSVCPLCNKNDVKTGVPSPYNSLNDTKQLFNIHRDKNDAYNIRVCTECALQLNNFEQFISEYKIDFFPLFIRDDFEVGEIKYLKQRKDGLTFFGILENIIKTVNNEIELDFILLHQKGGILYYDYVTNYKFTFKSQYKNYLSDKHYGPKITLKELRDIFANKDILGLKPSHFFENVDISETHRKYLIYKYRQKIFDLIYRDKQNFFDEDIAEIVLTVLENRLQNQICRWPTNNKKSKENELLDIYLNSDLFVKNPGIFVRKNDGGENMLDQIRKEKQEILDNGVSPNIDSDEKFAYYLGQTIYYLMSKSEAEDKMKLLSPMINAYEPEVLRKIVAEKYLDKYYYALSTYHDFRHKILAVVFDYLSNLKVPFNKIKIPFYVGFFDENIFYSKTQGNNGDGGKNAE